ncbi:MAG: SPOR domain-containing protein, partial [Rhodopila sp.]
TPAAAVAAPTPAPVVPPAAVVPSVPVAKPAVVANTPSAPAKPAIVANAPPKPASAKPPVAAAEARPVAPGHQPLVQFAALPSEDAAHAEWAQLAKKMPDLLNGKQPNFSRIDRDGRTFWRLRTSGFADAAQARVFCERVRAKGAACSVADF